VQERSAVGCQKAIAQKIIGGDNVSTAKENLQLRWADSQQSLMAAGETG
jgi:hypothetical protein